VVERVSGSDEGRVIEALCDCERIMGKPMKQQQ